MRIHLIFPAEIKNNKDCNMRSHQNFTVEINGIGDHNMRIHKIFTVEIKHSKDYNIFQLLSLFMQNDYDVFFSFLGCI